ncbi:MAG: hypothetical protein KF680_06480 [Cryobacterium sp.]|nr:hypothetical protein [Cryobacterium sp.]
MPLVLPDRIDEATIGRSLTRAQHTVALTCLIVTVVTLGVVHGARPELSLWVPALALLLPVALLFMRLRWPSNTLATVYLAGGGFALFTLELARHELAAGELAGERFDLLGVKFALVLCGATATSVRANVMWTAAGFVTSELASLVSSLVTGEAYLFSTPTLLAALVVVLLRPLASLVSSKLRAALPQLRQASLDNEAANQRAVLEQRAAALVHDTVLNQLAGIAAAPEGALAPRLRDRISRDVGYLTGDGWLDPVSDANEAASAQWRQSPVFAALQDSRLLGLTIETTGDLQALRRISGPTELALGLALTQCLANVLKHAGTEKAEIAVYETDTDVCVMVIDTGRGFDESQTGSDRLGLRNSVRRRIESVGGSVQVWSTLGQGTSIMLRVPAIMPEQATDQP